MSDTGAAASAMMGGSGLHAAVVAAYPAVRAGLRMMLESMPGIGDVRDLSPARLAAGGIEAPAPDVIIADVGADAAGFDLAALDEIFPDTPVVALAPAPDDYAAVMPPRPARAYLLRQADEEEVAAAVQAVVAGLVALDPRVAAAFGAPVSAGAPRTPEPFGGEHLTEREREVLDLLALGLPNKAIAFRLGISDHTVKFHVGAILAKLGAAGRTEAVMLAARRGLLPL